MVEVFAPPAPQGTGKGANTNQAGVTDETLKSRNEPRQQMMKAKKAECAHATAASGVGGVWPRPSKPKPKAKQARGQGQASHITPNKARRAAQSRQAG